MTAVACRDHVKAALRSAMWRSASQCRNVEICAPVGDLLGAAVGVLVEDLEGAAVGVAADEYHKC